jgi:UDP-glucose 4-epimerase
MVLITGGFGYLGARIAEALVLNGQKVRIGSSRDEPKVPFQLKSCEVVKIDFSNFQSLEYACKDISCILHLASPNAKDCEVNPDLAINVNCVGTSMLLKAASHFDVKKFLYFSTFHVYDCKLDSLIDEESKTNPINTYSQSHKIAEDYVIEANNHNSLLSCVFRLTNAIGSPLNKDCNCWSLIANDLGKSMALNKSAIIHSNKNITRDFVTIEDIINASLMFISNNQLKLGGEIFNISSSNSTSLESISDLLIQRCEAVLGFKPPLKFNNEIDNIKRSIITISNKKALKFGFRIQNNITGEIDQMLLNYSKWFKVYNNKNTYL